VKECIVDKQDRIAIDPDILRNYPSLSQEDIQACLRYASSALKSEKVYVFAVQEGS
jgi:uncharacterized protein (DUF433 family)